MRLSNTGRTLRLRNLVKTEEPAVLRENKDAWTTAYKEDLKNKTKKYRYRHPDIKSALIEETANKCVYCESKIGHNTPGDVEHKIPSSENRDMHFHWENLTIACTECNRRKNRYYNPEAPFLDPYSNDVESVIVHHGPIVCWRAGDAAAETTVRILELHNSERKELIERKIEKIAHMNNIIERMNSAPPLLKSLLRIQLDELRSKDSEYSGMIISIGNAHGIWE